MPSVTRQMPQMPSVTEAKKARTESYAAESVSYAGFDGKKAEFCPYDETSKEYDNFRAPLGLHVVLGSLCLGDVPLGEQRLLDIGCGTGTFLHAVRGKLGKVTGLEYNDGMIAQSRKRLGEDASLFQGSADALPFEAETFDACTVHQVIHHFPMDDDYAFARRSFEEAFRVLKPGGRLVLNTSTPEQQRDAFWWLSLFPKASQAICSRFPPLEVVRRHLEGAGFAFDANSVTVPLQRTLMVEERYLENGVRSGLSASYRAGDSSWSMAENMGELEDGLKLIKDMVQTGTAEEWLRGREALRLSMGQATFVTVRKP